MKKMAWKVLINASYMQREVKRFKKFFEENDIDASMSGISGKLGEEELMKIISEYDGVVSGDDAFTKRVLDKAKKLKVIAKWGTGIDSIDKEYAEKLGIRVLNTPDAFTEPVSDSVLAFILCFARNVLRSNDDIKNGKWDKIMGHSLDEATLGIIGLGDCGLAVARKASAFNMKILGNDIREIPEEVLKKYGVEFADKERIYRECDYISLNTDLNESSHHLINLETFKKMKKSAVVVNTSRGAVIDNAALVEALENGIIAGAALDVFEKEPLPIDSKLKKFENCIVSPHNANSSRKYWDRVHDSTLQNLLEGLKSGRR
ncbi:MAG: phosphoglycerate dehydrogenase [Nanoarchaeota archaeon]